MFLYFLRFEAENVLKMFLNYMHYMYFSKSLRKRPVNLSKYIVC